MARALFLLSIGLLAAATAVRAEPAAPLPPAEQLSLDAFAAAHEACQVWSDGCVVCRRIRESRYGCSTPGIACQPVALMCQDSKEEPKEEPKPAEVPKPAPAPKSAH